MLSLSQTTGYAVHALSCMTPDHPLLIREVAERTGIHRPYLAKIVNLLTRKKLLIAKRGCRGGILLARPADEISLFEVVEAVEGKSWMGHCLLGLSECQSQHICPSHDMWQRMKHQICMMLQKISLAEVSQNGANPRSPARALRCQPASGSDSVLEQLAAAQNNHNPAFGKGCAQITTRRVLVPKNGRAVYSRPKNKQPQITQQLQ